MSEKKYNISSIGLFGLETEFKLCHIPFLVHNDVYGAIALEGSSGTGKTTLVKRIGKLNEILSGGRVGVFSADKARYEDFVGVPIPDENSGSMKIYPMPNSVAEMETLLIDEINRATYDNQEKWLSLIATRVIDSIPTKCQYLFAAMNPILSNSNDTYEGVQPLDKALGERMYALITMPKFSNLDPKIRAEIMRSSFDQVSWVPSDEVVELHRVFVERAREFYNEYKNTTLEKIVDYVDAIQSDLTRETKKGLTVEARRAQYMVTNILAVHALNSVYKSSTIENSALAGLLISFPNRLWEQEVNGEALKMAHDRAKGILKLTAHEKKSSVMSLGDLDRGLNEVSDAVKSKSSKEIISKIINENLPDKKTEPLLHYVYTTGFVIGITLEPKLEKAAIKQNSIKQQEFSRLEKSYNEVLESEVCTKYVKLVQQLDKQGTMPKDYVYPEYISESDDVEDLKCVFDEMLKTPFGVLAVVITEVTKAFVSDVNDLMKTIEKMLSVMEVARSVKELYE